MGITIDLFGGDESVITIPPEETPEEIKRREEMRKRALFEIFKRTPQPEVVPQTLTIETSTSARAGE